MIADGNLQRALERLSALLDDFNDAVDSVGLSGRHVRNVDCQITLDRDGHDAGTLCSGTSLSVSTQCWENRLRCLHRGGIAANPTDLPACSSVTSVSSSFQSLEEVHLLCGCARCRVRCSRQFFSSIGAHKKQPPNGIKT